MLPLGGSLACIESRVAVPREHLGVKIILRPGYHVVLPGVNILINHIRDSGISQQRSESDKEKLSDLFSLVDHFAL